MVNKRIVASISKISIFNLVYMKGINSSDWAPIWLNEGLTYIISIINGATPAIPTTIDSDGMGMLGVIATKYENKTNIPPI